MKSFFNWGVKKEVETLRETNFLLGEQLHRESTIKENLRHELAEVINKSNSLETLLKNTLNELAEANTKINELKTSNILLEREVLKQKQLLEIKENKHKEEKKELNKKIKELEKELDKRYIIKKLPSGRMPKLQKMAIKSSTVQSKIIKDLKEN